MKKLPIIQSLWIGKSFSVMEQLCTSSFLQNGHAFHLYVYDEIKGVPKGVILKDATKIIHPEKIFKYAGYDTVAAFSDLFRYKLLLEKGGYWVDTDTICLKPFQYKSKYVFSSQRRKISSIKNIGRKAFRHSNLFEIIKANRIANIGVIKTPPNSEIMDYCYNESVNKTPDQLKWGQTGPGLFSKAVTKFNMWRYVTHPRAFCPVDYWNWESLINKPIDINLFSKSRAIHLWNEMWRRNNINKSGDFSKSCIYEQLKNIYLE